MNSGIRGAKGKEKFVSLEPQILAVLLILFLLASSISGRLPRWTGGGRSSLINSSSRMCFPSFQRSVRSCAWIIFQPRYALHPRHTISWIVYAPDVISWIEGRSYRTFVLESGGRKEISCQLERCMWRGFGPPRGTKGRRHSRFRCQRCLSCMTKQSKNRIGILVRYRLSAAKMNCAYQQIPYRTVYHTKRTYQKLIGRTRREQTH